ncbi:AAA family ATPase [Kocuria tytonis]|uniref:AAA domain-containing protein n=1 Tax=Kocuria tytonis TaxID=2054280 RepID=A0A495A9I9_9MICC|nr:ParA family protein [Kocuria tytonis]RKQ36709.1 hypothetical protein C1C97_003500 [Kocuria tytonis]
MSLSVVTLGPSTWPLVDRLERLHGEVTVVRRCLDLSELLACSHTGMAHVALVAEGAEELTASLLDQLESNALRVLVVAGHDDSRLAALGVASVPADVTGQELSRQVTRTAHAPRRQPPRGAVPGLDDARGSLRGAVPPAGERTASAPGTERAARDDDGAPRPDTGGPGRGDDPASAPARRIGGTGGAATRGEGPVAGGPPREDRPSGGDGGPSAVGVEEGPTWEPDAHAGSGSPEPEAVPHRVVAVWGPAGAPGRTVTAINVAAESALLGRRVLLVDADTYAASVAASLGMLDEAAGLAQACRLADQGRLDADGLRRCATAVSVAGGSMDVLTGITRHDRWPELRSSALELVLDRAREDYDLVVVDTSFSLESDEEISADFMAPRRNAGTLGAVAAADTVIAVGAADTLGVPRMVKALPDLLDAAPDAHVVVMMNKLRAAAAGRAAGAAVTEAWNRFSPGQRIAHTLTWDPGTCDDALLAGAVLAETAARSALRQEFTALARMVGRAGDPAGAAAAGAGATDEPAVGTRLGRRMGAWLRRG